MKITKLYIQNLRLVKKQLIEQLGDQTLVLGNNAQGKTTLLEAIYLLATFSSFRTPKENLMIALDVQNDPLAVARVRAEYIKEGRAHTIEVRLISETLGAERKFRKEILIDGVKRKPTEAIGTLRAVVFAPQMTEMIGGSQNERRRHLNMAVSQAIPGYAAALARYHEALQNRNALLKLGVKKNMAEQVAPWNDILAAAGAQIIAGRIRAAKELSRLTMPYQKRITEGVEMLRLVYAPAYDPAPPASGSVADIQSAAGRREKVSVPEIARGLKNALEQSLKKDMEAQTTTVGPHRDNIEYWVNGRDLGTNGSRGQMRTATLALKAAEAKWIENETGDAPILLLDDPMTELDPSRRSGLTELLKMPNQIIATATETLQFPVEFLAGSDLFATEGGRFARLEKETV